MSSDTSKKLDEKFDEKLNYFTLFIEIENYKNNFNLKPTTKIKVCFRFICLNPQSSLTADFVTKVVDGFADGKTSKG